MSVSPCFTVLVFHQHFEVIVHFWIDMTAFNIINMPGNWMLFTSHNLVGNTRFAWVDLEANFWRHIFVDLNLQIDKEDWKKLVHLMSWMNKTKEDTLASEADDSMVEKWHVDAAFVVPDDHKSHTGGDFTLGEGCIASGFETKSEL